MRRVRHGGGTGYSRVDGRVEDIDSGFVRRRRRRVV